ncbi:MAG: hypothetical protein ABI603_12885, partial [Acidobacteriota bacterium]
MNPLCRAIVATLVVAAAAAGPVFAQAPAAASPSPDSTQATPPPQPAETRYEETVVVSGSRAEETLTNTPATMTVIGSAQIERAT